MRPHAERAKEEGRTPRLSGRDVAAGDLRIVELSRGCHIMVARPPDSAPVRFLRLFLLRSGFRAQRRTPPLLALGSWTGRTEERGNSPKLPRSAEADGA